jgi:hypothetical protein
MREHDLEYLLACSPELKILALILSYGFPSRVPITSRSLCCLLLWVTTAEELDVVAAPLLQRLILFWPQRTRITRVKIGHAPKLTVLGYLDTADQVLQIGDTIIKVLLEFIPLILFSTTPILGQISLISYSVLFIVYDPITCHTFVSFGLQAGITNVTPNAVVPSVKVLALNVDFRVAQEVKTLISFLRCFPQVETLHIKVSQLWEHYLFGSSKTLYLST